MKLTSRSYVPAQNPCEQRKAEHYLPRKRLDRTPHSQCRQRCIGPYASREPRLHLIFDPRNAMSREFDAHREVTFRLQLIDLGLAQSRHRTYLSKSQHPNWCC